jgi:hypothetical protein
MDGRTEIFDPDQPLVTAETFIDHICRGLLLEVNHSAIPPDGTPVAFHIEERTIVAHRKKYRKKPLSQGPDENDSAVDTDEEEVDKHGYLKYQRFRGLGDTTLEGGIQWFVGGRNIYSGDDPDIGDVAQAAFGLDGEEQSKPKEGKRPYSDGEETDRPVKKKLVHRLKSISTKVCYRWPDDQLTVYEPRTRECCTVSVQSSRRAASIMYNLTLNHLRTRDFDQEVLRRDPNGLGRWARIFEDIFEANDTRFKRFTIFNINDSTKICLNLGKLGPSEPWTIVPQDKMPGNEPVLRRAYDLNFGRSNVDDSLRGVTMLQQSPRDDNHTPMKQVLREDTLVRSNEPFSVAQLVEDTFGTFQGRWQFLNALHRPRDEWTKVSLWGCVNEEGSLIDSSKIVFYLNVEGLL